MEHAYGRNIGLNAPDAASHRHRVGQRGAARWLECLLEQSTGKRFAVRGEGGVAASAPLSLVRFAAGVSHTSRSRADEAVRRS
jgi:hypothetical protein